MNFRWFQQLMVFCFTDAHCDQIFRLALNLWRCEFEFHYGVKVFGSFREAFDFRVSPNVGTQAKST